VAEGDTAADALPRFARYDRHAARAQRRGPSGGPADLAAQRSSTANIYSRVDLADLQAGIDRLGIPPAAEG